MTHRRVPKVSPSRRGRYIELDGLRGIAVASVVLYHYTSLFDRLYPGHGRLPLDLHWGFYGVQLFFLISGFVIYWTADRMGTVREFVVARFARLFPTYWTCLTLGILIVGLVRGQIIDRPVVELLLNYTMVQRLLRVRMWDGAYWSLTVELVFYFIIAIAMWRYGKLQPETARRMVLTWTSVGLIAAVSGHFLGGRLGDLVVLITAAQYAFLFGVGVLCFLSKDSVLDRWIWPVLLLGAVTTGVVEGLTSAVVVPLIAIAFIAVVRSAGVPLLRTRVLVWLGSISYPLYLLHQNIGYAIMEKVQPVMGRVGAFILALAIAIGLSVVVHRVVETRFSTFLRRRISPARH